MAARNDDFRLARDPRVEPPAGPVVLVILDGVGIGPGDEFDAVALARTPVIDRVRREGWTTRLKAHGTAVGLPSDRDMGNSEVGHNILGAGRVFDQGAKLVDRAIETGEIWRGAWAEIVARLRETGGTLHLVGLLSDGNVHSHEKHLHALLRRAAEEGLPRVRVHVLLDGRDVPETSALEYVDRLEEVLAEIRSRGDRDYRIASGGGRMVVTMDRYEADWSIVERGWHAHVLGDARPFRSAREAIETFRREEPGIIDQYLPAFTIVGEDGRPVGPVEDGDAVILFNFRGDRAIELSRAFEEGDGFDKFDRVRHPDVLFAGMMLYDGDLGIPRRYLVPPPAVQKTLSEYLARNGIPQFAAAETQKFGHVTYFWNGNRSGKFDPVLEEYVEIPSDQVPFDERPWMKSAQTADVLADAIRSGRFRFLRVNFAGGDMVGHTGNLDAAVLAVQSVDLALARILPAVRESRGVLIVTADHGNADDMVERDGEGNPRRGPDGSPKPRTSHTLNPVAFSVLDFSGRKFRPREGIDTPGLAHVAPTIVTLLGFVPPEPFVPSLLEVAG